MPALAFREIPIPTGGVERDQFELFAREFLTFLGFRIVVGPDRGPDAGRDMVVDEVRAGIAGETSVKWLVSCKHKAHSGAAVNPTDEADIIDRLNTHGCEGFLGFYSTVPSSGLAAKLNAPGRRFEIQTYDAERIETLLLASPEGRQLAERFFPVSYATWKKQYPRRAELLFAEALPLTCAHCRKNLLNPKPRGNVVLWTAIEGSRTEKLYWCCNGACDTALQHRHRELIKAGFVDGWESISDLVIPVTFIRWVLVSLGEFHKGMTYSDEALENMKTLLLAIFPLVSRDMSDEEKARIKSLLPIPSYLGGWG